MKEDVKKWEAIILIVKNINMLNSKSLILKLACRHKSTAHRFNIKKGYLFFSYYFLGSFAFLLWFSCIFSVWTKCYFQGNTCSFSCLVVKCICVWIKGLIRLQSCANQIIKDLFEKKPNPLPQLFLPERKQQWKRHWKIPG